MTTSVKRNIAKTRLLLQGAACVSDAAAPKPAASLRVREEIGGRRPRILVVDDNDTNLEIVEAYLGNSGYHVRCVSSGLDAIQVMRDDAFDLVLMDIQMPVMDGVTATQRIRDMCAPTGNIPIIAMTGNVMPQQVRSYLDAGMNGHVGKPINRGQLLSHVQRSLPKTDDASAGLAKRPSDFEGATLDDFVSAVGSEKAQQIAGKFLEGLSQAFQSTFAEAQREAHGLINVAGVLGFEGLVAACRCVMETARAQEPERGRESMRELQRARLIALHMYTKRLLPRLFGAALPSPLSA
jgi:CheY-like chemotaxis protein